MNVLQTRLGRIFQDYSAPIIEEVEENGSPIATQENQLEAIPQEMQQQGNNP